MTKHYCDKCGGEAGFSSKYETQIEISDCKKLRIHIVADTNSFEHVCRDCLIRAWYALIAPTKRVKRSKKTRKAKRKP